MSYDVVRKLNIDFMTNADPEEARAHLTKLLPDGITLPELVSYQDTTRVPDEAYKIKGYKIEFNDAGETTDISLIKDALLKLKTNVKPEPTAWCTEAPGNQKSDVVSMLLIDRTEFLESQEQGLG